MSIGGTLQSLVDAVIRALAEAGYVSEPDPANNTSNALAYLKVFCKGIPKNKRVAYLNLVFGGTGGEQVTLEGEDAIYVIPKDLKALLKRLRYKLPCASFDAGPDESPE